MSNDEEEGCPHCGVVGPCDCEEAAAEPARAAETPEEMANRLDKDRADKEAAARSALDKSFGMFGFIVMPSEAAPPILNVPLRTALHNWLYELNAPKELKRVGLKPRTRALLKGPPGCGKTMLAHHIAARLGIPMIVVQSHIMLSKWVSESGERIGKLFRAARRDPNGVVLFFDEFDSVAKDRAEMGGQAADNERNNITNAFLQEMDRYEGLLFAATNVEDRIDKAIWRRFQMQIEIGKPGRVEREAILRLYFKPFAVEEPLIEGFADAMDGASPALIQEVCEALKRGLVLGPRMKQSMTLEDMLRRLVSTIEPPPEMEPPKFWRSVSPTIRDLSDLPWPPRLAAKGG